MLAVPPSWARLANSSFRTESCTQEKAAVLRGANFLTAKRECELGYGNARKIERLVSGEGRDIRQYDPDSAIIVIGGYFRRQ